jgi:uncharacterized protein YqhQ
MAKNKPFYYGGQAVIEGVMMRGKNSIAVAVRQPDGQINIISKTLPKLYKGKLRDTIFVRGVIALIETLALGIDTLFHSAQVAFAEEEEQISKGTLWGTAAISLIVSVAIFFVGPLLITNYFIYPYIESPIVANLIEGLLRIGIFVLYLWTISFMADVRRVFAYHGAEHKTVNAYEKGASMQTEQVIKYSTAHVRCGTSFLLIVLVIAIVVFALIGKPPLWLGVISRIILLPVIAAIGYEFVRLSARYADNPFVRVLLTPGLLLQSMTTREPDEKQLEVAIAALTCVINMDTGNQSG